MQPSGSCQRPFLLTHIPVPIVAAIIVGLTLLWYVALTIVFRNGFKNFEHSDFWDVIYFGAPFTNLALAPIMASVYSRDLKQHPGIFWSALWFGLSPWLLVFLLIGASY